MASTRRVCGDDGTTLMELMVGMSVMTIFMAIFTGAVVTMFSSTNKTQALVNSSTQLNLAFEKLDLQVRYAVLIDQPIGPATSPSVTFQTDDDPKVTTCRRLTIRSIDATSVLNLVEHTWKVKINPDGSLAIGGTAFDTQLATGVVLTAKDGTAVIPFAVSTPNSGLGTTMQQLRLRLVDLDGGGKSQTRSFTDTTFSARNSTAPNTPRSYAGGSICAQPEPT
jgi:hypothetical protein